MALFSFNGCFSKNFRDCGRKIFTKKILHDQIFEPLEMNDTSFYLPKEDLKRLMHSYEFNHLNNTLTENILEPRKLQILDTHYITKILLEVAMVYIQLLKIL